MSVGKVERQSPRLPMDDGTVYSSRKNFCPFSVPPLEDYASILGEEKMRRLEKAAQRLKGLKVLELNATARGGGGGDALLFGSAP